MRPLVAPILCDGSTKKISKIPSVEMKGVTAFDNFLAD